MEILSQVQNVCDFRMILLVLWLARYFSLSSTGLLERTQAACVLAGVNAAADIQIFRSKRHAFYAGVLPFIFWLFLKPIDTWIEVVFRGTIDRSVPRVHIKVSHKRISPLGFYACTIRSWTELLLLSILVLSGMHIRIR